MRHLSVKIRETQGGFWKKEKFQENTGNFLKQQYFFWPISANIAALLFVSERVVNFLIVYCFIYTLAYNNIEQK